MKSEYLAEVKVVMIPNYAIGLLYPFQFISGMNLNDNN